MTTTPVGIGVIGCGAISEIYLTNCTAFDNLNIIACSDVVDGRAAAAADQHGIERVCTTEELLADPRVEIAVNLTPPGLHAGIGMQVLEAGKHLYAEKPLAVTREEGQRLLAAAAARGLRIGSAPDTFLGGGIQTCRKLIDEGAIGKPIGASAAFMCPGHERWHPAPDFYYQVGGGPMFDMGPYYLTALTTLIAPVQQVSAFARTTYAERTITSEPLNGTRIEVNTPTHIAANLALENGAVASLQVSFDVWGHHLPHIEIYGTRGSMSVPDPNAFDGPVTVRRAGEPEWVTTPLSHGFTENSRGLGVSDMARALREGGPHRASGELAFHVLDTMAAVLESATTERHVTVASSFERSQPLSPIG